MASKKKQARKAIIDMIWSGIESRIDECRVENRDDDLMKEIDQAFTEIIKMWKN